MNRFVPLALIALCLFEPAEAEAARRSRGSHRLGVGAHYWKTLDKLDESFDEDGIDWNLTYQYKPGPIGLGLDLGLKDKGFGGAEKDVYEPQAYLILGQKAYAAAGVASYYTDGDFLGDPVYFLRAGVDWDLVPGLALDLHAVYRFDDFNQVDSATEDISTDTVTLGAALRLRF